MQHSIYWHPLGRRRKQTIGIILSQGERKKGIWGTGVEAAIFVIFLAKCFLQGTKFATPLISRLSVPAQQQACLDTKRTSGSVTGG